LPASCQLQLQSGQVAEAAAALRSHRELVGELRWHRASVAAFLADMGAVEALTRNLLDRIERRHA